MEQGVTITLFLFEQKESNAICTQRVRLPIQVGADSIIQVESDSILLCSVIYKFVTTNKFNCHGTTTIACICFRTEEAENQDVVFFNRVPKTGSEMFQEFTKVLGSTLGYHTYIDPSPMDFFPGK